MTITLNRTIVPALNKEAAARLFVQIFGLDFAGGDHFARVRVNNTQTFLFDDSASFQGCHCSFYVSDVEFDAIL